VLFFIFLPRLNAFISGLSCSFRAVVSVIVFLSLEHISLLVPTVALLVIVFLELK